MTDESPSLFTVDNLPAPPEGRDVVLHTRVVTGEGGGPDKTILLSASYLADSSYWLAAAYMHAPDDAGFGAIRQRAVHFNCPLISVPDRGPLDGGVIRKMLAICRRLNVRIWHGHDYKSNLIGLMLRPFWSMKFVTTVHGWVKHTTRTPLYYAVDRWSLPFYHHVICVSQDLVDRVRGLRLPEERVSLIHNAIDERAYKRRGAPAESAMRQKRGVPAQRLVIGAAGRLSAEKGFSDLIRAVDALVRKGHDIELWIAGEGDARPDLERLIAELGQADRMKLLGFCDDMIGLFESLDLFVLSSLREGLPNVVLEAMAMHVPVVSTRVAGVPNLIVDGETGLLCPIADTGALTTAVDRALSDAALRQRLADAGRAEIEREYSFTQRMHKVRAVYDKVLGVTSRTPQPARAAQ